MNVKSFTYTNARRSSRWRELMDRVAASRTPYWFTSSDSVFHQAQYLDRPWHQPYTETVYWAERNATSEDTFGYYVFSFDGETVERVTPWEEPHATAEIAAASAMFLAAA